MKASAIWLLRITLDVTRNHVKRYSVNASQPVSLAAVACVPARAAAIAASDPEDQDNSAWNAAQQCWPCVANSLLEVIACMVPADMATF